MTRRPIINEKLYEQLENKGHEIQYTYRGKDEKKVKIKAKVIDPIKRLYEDGHISYQESSAADKYRIDFDFSLCTNYAQAIANGIPAGTSEFGFADRHSQASMRVNDVKMLVNHLCNHRQRKLRKKLTEITGTENLTIYQIVLCDIFEYRLSINRVSESSGFDNDNIKKRAQQIAKVIYNYYEN